jgi:hypothetical protein
MSKIMGLREALDRANLEEISSDAEFVGGVLSKEIVVGDETVNVSLIRHNFPEINSHSYHFKVSSDRHKEGIYRTYCKNSWNKARGAFQFALDYVTQGASV